jgi:hypothetical protein
MFKYILIFLLFTSSAVAHSWYPTNCCSEQDCKPVPCDHLGENEKGEVTYRGKAFSKEKTYSSQDSSCHVCIGNGGTPYCAFVLQGS